MMLEYFIHSMVVNFVIDMLLLLSFLVMIDAGRKVAYTNEKPRFKEPEPKCKGILGFIDRYCFDMIIFTFLEILVILNKYQDEISWIPKQYL